MLIKFPINPKDPATKMNVKLNIKKIVKCKANSKSFNPNIWTQADIVIIKITIIILIKCDRYRLMVIQRTSHEKILPSFTFIRAFVVIVEDAAKQKMSQL